MIHRLHRIVQGVNRASGIDHALDLIMQSLTDDLNAANACTIFLASEDDPDLLVSKPAAA